MKKYCWKCQKNKPLNEYNKHKDRVDGLQTHCRECNKQISKDYYHRNLIKHRLATRARNQKIITRNKGYINKVKIANGCYFCKESELCCLDFHHKNPAEKGFSLSYARWFKWSKIENEIKKCIVLCANCHRKLHKGLLILPNEINITIPELTSVN